MQRIVWTIIVLLFAGMAIATPAILVAENRGTKQQAEPSGTTVVMARLAFAPKELSVPPGTEVLFDNRDVAPHTVTADAGRVDSGILNPRKAFRVIVDAPFAYHCEIHPDMTAKVVLAG